MKNNHSTTLVPLETWLYHSPKLKLQGRSVDMGLVCEALLYYENIALCIDNRDQFNAVIAWFKQQDSFSDLLYLLNDGIISFAFHSFMTYPIYDQRIDSYSLWNLDDEESKNEDVFQKRILYNPDLHKYTNSRERIRLFTAVNEKRVFELKAHDFGDAIENAKVDFIDPQKASIIVQSFIDDLYHEFGFEKPIAIQSSIKKEKERTIISWNINFDIINSNTDNKLGIHRGIPLSGIMHCNRLIKTASLLDSDLYLGSVMSSLVNNKLLEIDLKKSKVESVIQELNTRVEFPKISDLINKGDLTFKDILSIRVEAEKFRLWLQQEGDRDRDAIIAYQNEVAKKTGLAKFGAHTLSIAGTALGGLVGAKLSGPIGGAVGAVAGRGIDAFISSFNKDWKPVVFGDWMTKYVDKKLSEESV